MKIKRQFSSWWRSDNVVVSAKGIECFIDAPNTCRYIRRNREIKTLGSAPQMDMNSAYVSYRSKTGEK